MDQSIPSGSPGSKHAQSAASGRMSPPSNAVDEGDHDQGPPEATISNEQTRSSTPPAPLLRPAQGAWERAYTFGKPQVPPRSTQTQIKDVSPQTANTTHPRGVEPQGKPSPAPHTRSKDTSGKRREPSTPAPTPAYAGQDHGARVTHPESAQRHSQAGVVVAGQPSTQVYNPPQEPREHYRNAVYTRPASSSTSSARVLSPATAPAVPQYPPPDQPPGPHPRPTQHEHPRPPASQLYAPSSYYPSGSTYNHPPPPTNTHLQYPQHRSAYPEPDPYAPAPRNQTSAYAGMNYTDHDDAAPVVYLLMEDLRVSGGVPDYQYAEVSVSLRPGEEGGWWADGEEVIKALQRTPSRLEGAAKVFARRGKYRQCFVRFSDDGTMECQPSSLMVSPQKNIQLIIEPNLEGRTSSRESYPPAIPQHEAYQRNYPSPIAGPSQSRDAYDDYGQYTQPQSQAYPSPQYYMSQNPNGKRSSAEISSNTTGEDHLTKRPKTAQAPSSSSSSKRPSQPRQPALSQPRPGTAGSRMMPGSSSLGLGSVSQATPTTRMSSPEESLQDPISPQAPTQRHETLSVAPKPPKEVVNAAIVAYLRSHIQNEEYYMEFAVSKGRLLPIPDLLKGYRFATRIVNTWANRKTPSTVDGCPNKRITKNHVLQALLRQTSWGSDCEQTLQLADRYGPGGPREDPRVVEILSGGSMLPEKSADKAQGRSGSGSQGSVALLDFLKDVDREHKARQEEELRKSVSSGGKDPNESSKGEGESAGD